MECNICFESLDKHTSYITPCIHKFCIYCIKKWSETRYQYTSVILCPVCRHIIDIHNIRTMYNDMMDKKTIQEHMVEIKSKKIFTYNEFILLDGVDLTGDNYISLDMVTSNKWMVYLPKLLFVQKKFYQGSNTLLYVMIPSYAKEIIFKLFKKKIYIRNKMIIIEISSEEQMMIDSIHKMIREKVKLHTEIEGLQTINIETDEIIGRSSIVVKTTKKTGFAIKLNEYNCYHGDSEIDLMKYENLSTDGNIAFHMIGIFCTDIHVYKYYANAIEISIDKIPVPYKEKVIFKKAVL